MLQSDPQMLVCIIKERSGNYLLANETILYVLRGR